MLVTKTQTDVRCNVCSDSSHLACVQRCGLNGLIVLCLRCKACPSLFIAAFSANVCIHCRPTLLVMVMYSKGDTCISHRSRLLARNYLSINQSSVKWHQSINKLFNLMKAKGLKGATENASTENPSTNLQRWKT